MFRAKVARGKSKTRGGRPVKRVSRKPAAGTETHLTKIQLASICPYLAVPDAQRRPCDESRATAHRRRLVATTRSREDLARVPVPWTGGRHQQEDAAPREGHRDQAHHEHPLVTFQYLPVQIRIRCRLHLANRVHRLAGAGRRLPWLWCHHEDRPKLQRQELQRRPERRPRYTSPLSTSQVAITCTLPMKMHFTATT